ncbi:MAG TPA: class IV adenylate cyclase [Gemmatimonadaceae bacterium]|nr:class IV adenylate cyclase [Gemmatimonadaceae bacterium]
MREVELKAVLDAWDVRRARVERAGAALTFAGRLEDRRYDTPDRQLLSRDEVLRLRTYLDARGGRCELAWKGPTGIEGGFKVREELHCAVGDPRTLAAMLEHLGYVVTLAIDRTIAQFDLGGAIVRFERYPRMDDLVEVEGTPEAIEHGIAATGIARGRFTAEALPAFVERFESRTGQRAVLSDSADAVVLTQSLRDAR